MASEFNLQKPWKIIEDDSGVRLHDTKSKESYASDDLCGPAGLSAAQMIERMAVGAYEGWLQEPIVKRFRIGD